MMPARKLAVAAALMCCTAVTASITQAQPRVKVKRPLQALTSTVGDID